jgi:hypothetical protein
MKFTKLVPNVFYKDIKDGITLFVEVLEFIIEHDEIKSSQPFCVVSKDNLRINIFQNAHYAELEHPEFRLVTENIEEVYNHISKNHSKYLNPNLDKVTLRPWNAREFAIIDGQIGIIFQAW